MNNYSKFKQHLSSGGLPYAIWRGAKYFIFLAKVRYKKSKIDLNFIAKGKISIVCTESGIKIFWANAELTTGIGLHSLINTLGLWTDSSKANWSIIERGNDYFILKVIFQELPVNQIWKVKIEDQQKINLQIDMEVEEDLRINEIRVMGLIKDYYKNWVCDYKQGDFRRLDKELSDVYLSNQPAHLIGVRFPVGKTGFLNAFSFDCNDSNWLPIIQNPPSSVNGRLIGVRSVFSKEKTHYPIGNYHIISIGLDLSEDGSGLDIKTEQLRKNLLEDYTAIKFGDQKRKIRVLLVNLPWQRDGKEGVRAGSRWPHIKNEAEDNYLPFPFFLAYATALLQKHDIQASMIDAIAQGVNKEKFLEMVLSMEFDYLVAETSIPSFYDDLDLLRKMASFGMNIILCGPNHEIYQPLFLQNNTFIRFVIYGEYEFTLLDLVESLRDKKDLSGVRGLIYKDNGIVKVNPKREPFGLDLLPWPYREGLPMDKYLDAPGDMPLPSVQMMASRGCPFKCQFCLWPQVIYQGHHYRVRQIKDVVDEMQYLVEKKGFKSVYFDDDTFNIGKERMLAFCREIKNRKLNKIKWAIMARPDLMDEEILQNMKAAGLWAIKYGVESSVQNLVDQINKNMDLEKTTRMVKLSIKMGIKVHLTFTFGLPGETKETIQQTINYVKNLNPYSAQFSITTPFPGTDYYKTMDDKGLIVSKDLSDYDGHFKSVIKLKDLSSTQLEMGKEMAVGVWQDHLRKRDLWHNSIIKFYSQLREKGLFYIVHKSLVHLKRNIFVHDSIRPDYKKPKSYDDIFNSATLGPADILLIQSPPWDITMPPLGIAYLSSYLKKCGYNACIFDLNIALYNLVGNNIKHLWEQRNYGEWVKDDSLESACGKLKDLIKVVFIKLLGKLDIKYIGLSVNFASIPTAIVILRTIKSIKPEIKIILGGWGCVNEHMRGLFPSELVDIFVVGEGEATLVEVLEVLNGRKNEDEISGAIFNHKSLTNYKPRLPITDLDSIPFPTFKEFNLQLYQSRNLPLFTSRGCISQCNFCNDWSISKPYRYRTAKYVFEEIKYHIKNHQTKTFSFKDLLCNGNISNLNLLADLIIKSEIKIDWDSQAIPRKEMTYGFLCKLKQTGCSTLIYGIESFSNNVLKRMGKIFTSQIAEQVIKDTYRAGIKSCINIIVGFPGETEEDFQETLGAIERNRQYLGQIGAISVCLINNNSDLENNYQRYNLKLSENAKIRAKEWVTSDNLNTYQIRQNRAKQILSLVNKIGLKYETLTI